jgi:signal transduction histidine kinase
MMDKADREDDLSDWLMDHEIKKLEFAENLVDFDFKPEDLDHMNACTPVSEELEIVLAWVNNYLLATKMIADIKESSQRISQLVTSVKTFTHMDRDSDKQLLDIHAGIRNTLTMLDYKLKKGNIKLAENFDLSLPQVKAMAGELNQVWTNVIDNAIDAMEVNGGGLLEIKTKKDRQFVEDNHKRQRTRHTRGDAIADIRPVFYHEGYGQGHRARGWTWLPASYASTTAR